MSDKLRWRSQQFSALGAGFMDDDTVEDGLHLRWVIDPRLGLPIESDNNITGVFRVSSTGPDFIALHELDLISLSNNSSYTVYSDTTGGGGSGLDTSYSEGTRFYKTADLQQKLLIQKFFNLVRQVDPDDLYDGEKELISYLEKALGGFQGEASPTSWFHELGELCAADVHMSLNDGVNGPHAWVEGYDRHDNLIARDYVGMNVGTPKTVAKLRAPNIYYYKVVSEPNVNPPTHDEIYWMFAEDYCQGNFWEPLGERRFVIREGTYTPEFVESELYGPFKKGVDWDVAAEHLKLEFVENQFVQTMAAQPDTLQMLKQKARLFFGLPEDQPPDEPEIELPVLPSLIQASVDPLMANIMGFYYYAPPDNVQNQRDYMIEAYLPFFQEENLLILRDRLESIFNRLGLPITTIELEKLTGLPAGVEDEFLRSTALCGLVMNPELSPKPEPIIPSTPVTVVQAEDVPSQTNKGMIDIFVNGRLRMNKGDFLIEPYLNSIAYAVERDVANSGFINVIEHDDQDDADILDELGILPGIYLPKNDKKEDVWELRDDFVIQNSADDTVQYRIRGYDIFGRPSQPEMGNVESIPIPCYPPLRPGQLAANLTADGNDLNLELFFSVTDVTLPLRAIQEKLEIVAYPLPLGTSGAAESVEWAGTKRGRTFNVDYHPNGAFLNTSTLALGCTELNWNAHELIWTPVASGDCDPDFPVDMGTLSLAEFATPMNDEAETDQRMYRLYTKIGEIGGLPPGNHRWCIRLRIEGQCDTGQMIYTTDVCVAAEHAVIPPPPVVLQPPQQLIPESTYADPAGDAFYYLDLQSFFPPNTQNEPLVNIYQVLLNRLTDTPEDIVDGEYFTPEGMDGLDGADRIQEIGRAQRTKFQRVNETPIPLTADTRYYPVPVRGDLEEYYVVGVIGANVQFSEKDWRQAGIVLFKTPQPLPTPKLNFESADYNMAQDPVTVTLNFRAEFAAPVDVNDPLPKIQIMRHDLSTGQIRFVGETLGVAGPAEGQPGEEIYPYSFSLADANPKPHRRYRYEAILMQHVQKRGKYIKSGQSAACELLVPYRGNVSPFTDKYGVQTDTINGATASFTFMAGDFDLSLTHIVTADNSSQRHAGRIYRGELHGISEATLNINRSTGEYTLIYEDNSQKPAVYTLRLWQGQQRTWSQKAVKNV